MSCVKIEAVVIRERIETVIDAVEEHAGHVGVTVIEAVGHGRQRGITHEYRGRVFESRFLPKALLVFVARRGPGEGDRRGDRRRRPQWQRVGRRDRVDDPDRERDAQPDRPSAGGSRGGRMTNKDLLYAASTIWVVMAAFLVMFMQAGFAFLEAGLTRMKNVGHIAAKNVLIFALASIVYYLVGFGIAFGDGGNGLVGGSGFFPNVDDLMSIGAGAVLVVLRDPRRGRLPVRGRLRRRLARDRLGRDGGADEALRLHRLRRPLHADLLGRLALDLVARRLALREGHAGLRRLDRRALPGRARAALAGALLLGPRIGKYGPDGKPNAIPGHNMAYTTLGVIILWFGWFGFNPGSTLSVDFGGLGFFAYVALNTNIAAAAGVLGALVASWIVIKKPDISMMLNGAIGALVAITAACAFVAPWAAIVIGFVAGVIVVFGVLLVERIGIDDPIGAVAAHGMSGVWGTLALGFLTLPSQAKSLATGSAGLFYGGGFHQLGVQALGLVVGRRVHVHRLVPDPLRAEEDVGHPGRARRSSRADSTSTSTACGATPSSTSRSRAGTGRRRTRTSAPHRPARGAPGSCTGGHLRVG